MSLFPRTRHGYRRYLPTHQTYHGRLDKVFSKRVTLTSEVGIKYSLRLLSGKRCSNISLLLVVRGIQLSKLHVMPQGELLRSCET